MIELWQSQIKAAAAKGAKLTIRGSGSKSFCSPSVVGEVLDTRSHVGIVEYEPKELVIVVRCGTGIADVEKTMADAGQMLAFEPPHFGADATIGGMVATGLSGPRRPYAGAVRDFVLGCKVLDGKGDHLSFGGKVMKNVAGFDVSRLLTGSYGTLGVITETAFKCLPLPKAQQTRVFSMDAASAIDAMNRWYAAAHPITATTWVAGNLYVRLAGAEPSVMSSAAKLGGEILANDVAWWRDWREQRHEFFAGDAPLARIACKSTVECSEPAATQAIDWGGAQRWLRVSTSAASVAALQPVLLEVQAKIKSSFDPYNTFPSLSL